jgi:ABC-type transport system involved in multi-copper enzyme maturation permease subunit
MFGKIFSWEFLAGKRLYMIFLLYFLMLFSSGLFLDEKVIVETIFQDIHEIDDFTPGNLINMFQLPSNLWWFSFPIISAYCVYMFSHEYDKGILRTYFLSCARKSTVFTAKLLAIFAGIFASFVASLLIAYPLADPTMFLANPLEVYVNLPRSFLIYASMLYIMIGLSVLSAATFKKPLYAFASPLAIVYTLNTTHLDVIADYIPPTSFQALGSPIGLYTTEQFLRRFSTVWPAVVASTIFLAIAYVIFTKRDIG